MNHSHSVIVAYGHNGRRSALNLAEALESIADVQLRSYDELQSATRSGNRTLPSA